MIITSDNKINENSEYTILNKNIISESLPEYQHRDYHENGNYDILKLSEIDYIKHSEILNDSSSQYKLMSKKMSIHESIKKDTQP